MAQPPGTIMRGNPPAADHQPDPALMEEWMEEIEETIGFGAAGVANLAALRDLTLAAGDLLYVDATPALVKLAKGSAGQVLTMNSGGALPEWATPAASPVIASGELNGSGTPAWTKRSGFSATVTDLGAGLYRVAFAAAEADAFYLPVFGFTGSGTGTGAQYSVSFENRTTAGFDIRVVNNAGTETDLAVISVAVIRMTWA